MATVLITGVSGSLARLAAMELMRRGDTVVGVDYRRRPIDLPEGVIFYQANYNKTRIHDAFRRHEPDIVLHLGRVGNLKVEANKRFDLNVIGSAKIQELCIEHRVRRLVVLSTFHIYGAHAHNHIPILEDEPLRATQTVPQLADAVQLDTQALSWSFRHPELRTVVLRPTNVVGPHINNTASSYLRRDSIPYMLGYNPMWQFIHESDMLRALLATTESDASGVYNVAGKGALPIVEALKLTGAKLVPIPASLAEFALRFVTRRESLPLYMIDFLKYPVIVSDDSFRKTFRFEPRVGAELAVRTCVSRAPMEAVLGT